ncbi:hypothetical protein B0A49_12651, partial [Cryomyces minteri]
LGHIVHYRTKRERSMREYTVGTATNFDGPPQSTGCSASRTDTTVPGTPPRVVSSVNIDTSTY